jgi:hypothetical protein
MFNFNGRLIFYVIMIFLIAPPAINGREQSESHESTDLNLKKSMHFDDWPGKNKEVKNGINLSKEKISALSGTTEIKPKKIFFISRKKNGEPFVSYRSKWQQNENDFMEITISFLNSGIEAQDYLFNYYILSSTLPLNVIENSRDVPPVVGDVSFYKGRIFIRNNIVVKIHAEGKMTSRSMDIAREIDALLLAQNRVESFNKLTPRINKDSGNILKIVEP